MNPTIPEFCQLVRIAFTIQNGPYDGLSCCSTQITDDVSQLDIHLCKGFLHALNASCHSCGMLRTQPPISSQHPNIGWWLERVVQSAVGVKFQQPLTLLYIALPARQVFGVTSVYKKYLESTFFQDVVEENPIDSRGLHGNRLHAATAKPLCQAVKICCKALKSSYWFGIPVWTNCHVVTCISNVDPRCIRMNNLQPRVDRSQTTGKFFLRYFIRVYACFVWHPFSPDLKSGCGSAR